MKSMRRIFVIWFRCGWRGELDAAVLGGGWGWLLPSSCAASPWKLRLSVWCVGNFNWGPCIVLHSKNIGLLLSSPPCAHKKYKIKYLFLLFLKSVLICWWSKQGAAHNVSFRYFYIHSKSQGCRAALGQSPFGKGSMTKVALISCQKLLIYLVRLGACRPHCILCMRRGFFSTLLVGYRLLTGVGCSALWLILFQKKQVRRHVHSNW